MNILLPFTFANIPVRGRLLRLTGLEEHIPTLNRGTSCAQTLAELLTTAALLSHDTKHQLSVTLQIQHAGLGVLIFARCNQKGQLKAYANTQAQGLEFPALAKTEGGLFVADMAAEATDSHYQSLIPLTEPTAAGCLASYFENSVQTPTLLPVYTDGESALALMLQTLPHEEAAEDDWNRLKLILKTLEAPEALDFSQQPEVLLQKLFAEDDVTVYPAEHPAFVVDDPRPRMLAALASLPAEDIQTLLEEGEGRVTLTDDTTGVSVTFSAEELAHLHDSTTGQPN